MGIQKKHFTAGVKVLISDTNILFDIIAISALPEFFGLDFEICTTDFVLAEIQQPKQQDQIEFFIRSRKLTIFNLTHEEINEVVLLPTNRTFKGITDRTVLWKSLQLKCLLLTGDRKLRLEAIDQGLEVHGTIWVIEQMLDSHLINHLKAIEMLENLKIVNPSLPHSEIDQLIAIHRNG